MKWFGAACVMIALAFCLVFIGTPSLAQEKGAQAKPQAATNVTDTKAAQSRGAESADPNIKAASAVNQPGAKPAPAPPAKGGPKTRGAGQPLFCEVHVDNRTDLFIKVYIDGTYRGMMDKWGDLFDYTISGRTQLYARADFTDGSYKYWGPSVVNCPDDGTYTWRLHP